MSKSLSGEEFVTGLLCELRLRNYSFLNWEAHEFFNAIQMVSGFLTRQNRVEVEEIESPQRALTLVRLGGAVTGRSPWMGTLELVSEEFAWKLMDDLPFHRGLYITIGDRFEKIYYRLMNALALRCSRDFLAVQMAERSA